MAAEIVKWVIVTIIGLGAISTINMIGKDRKPTTPQQAIVAVLINAALIVGIIVFWQP
jgi:hypothetical protein